uniref:Uncharacterized protein n=1 Tax=Paraburkholderia sprentiae WSM5005 TaxID=754502 RepID=A0A1I9YW43_9BURK
MHAVGPAVVARPPRSAQPRPTCAFKQLRSAHSGPAGHHELRYWGRERFWRAVCGQRESDEFEAIGHAQ